MSSTNLLYKLLNKYNSLLEMVPKVPARDRESLSLVYTPGVGQVCNDIKEKPELIYQVTNKANSILIITDGSDFPNSDPKNYSVLPYLETLAVFYKLVANVDAYPIILDKEQVKNPEDIYELLYNLTPGFAGYELYGFEKSKVEKVLALDKEKSLKSLLLTSHVKSQVDATLSGLSNVKSYTLVAGFLRAALDCQVYSGISNEAIAKFAEGVAKHKELLQKDNFYEIAQEAAFEAAKVFSAGQLCQCKDKNPELVKDKLERYHIEGPVSWLKHTTYDYMNEEHGYKKNAVELHKVHIGVTHIKPKLSFRDISAFEHLFNKDNLKEVSDYILKDPAKNAYDVTLKNNMCAIITNGTAILGLGDIGSEAGMPVMEGKSVLFKQLAGVDVVPFGLKEKDDQKFVNLVSKFGHTFAAINLEDIKAPSCFHIEKGLQERLDIPIFHDDQHGTAIVAAAAFLNALKLTNKKIEEVKVVVNGGGAAGVAITELLLDLGLKRVVVCDTKGAIYEGRPHNMNDEKNKLAAITNREKEQGTLAEVLKGADCFIGVSVGGVLNKEMVKSMNEKPIIFAFANPDPEIYPDEAKAAGAFIVGTGRSDFANQVNNSLAFPGIFRGAIDIRASKISGEMKKAAAHAIANLVTEGDLRPEFVIPGALDYKVPLAVAISVVKTGTAEGVAKKEIDLESYKEGFKYFVLNGEFNRDKDIAKH